MNLFTYHPRARSGPVTIKSKWAIFLGATAPRPTRIQVPVSECGNSRQPYILELFANVIQDGIIRLPDVHHFYLTINDRRNGTDENHDFQVIFADDQLAPINRCVLQLHPGQIWRGSILIMRIGKRGPLGPVDVRHGDRILWEFALAKLLENVVFVDRNGPLVPLGQPVFIMH